MSFSFDRKSWMCASLRKPTIHKSSSYGSKQAEKLKSREMKDEGWKMKDEGWKMKDERWKIKDEGLGVLVTDRLTD